MSLWQRLNSFLQKTKEVQEVYFKVFMSTQDVLYIYMIQDVDMNIYKLGLIRQILNRTNVGIFPVRQLGNKLR